MNNLRNLLLGTALAAVAWPALAHGDEDHSEPNPVVAAVPMAAQGPRAEAQTDAFELVATLAQDRLVLHIDRFEIRSRRTLTKKRPPRRPPACTGLPRARSASRANTR